jgi:hypothetical protein
MLGRMRPTIGNRDGIACARNALLALAAAVLWGGGDFSGGMGVKSAGGGVGAALRVVLLSHATSFTVLVAIARLRGDAFPHGALLAWGWRGVAGGLSLTASILRCRAGRWARRLRSAGCWRRRFRRRSRCGRRALPG